MANVYAANSCWAKRSTPKSDIARLEKRALDDGWSEEWRRRASKIMAFPVRAVNEQRMFPIPKKWYATGAWLKEINIEISRVHDPLYIIHLMSDPKGCFPRRSRRKDQDSRENKTNWFPEGPDIKCFVIFLHFHFNSNKRITGANPNSRLGTYSNTNLILKTTEWMIYKVPSLYYLHHFPPLAAVFLLGTSWITLKIVAF